VEKEVKWTRFTGAGRLLDQRIETSDNDARIKGEGRRTDRGVGLWGGGGGGGCLVGGVGVGKSLKDTKRGTIRAWKAPSVSERGLRAERRDPEEIYPQVGGKQPLQSELKTS